MNAVAALHAGPDGVATTRGGWFVRLEHRPQPRVRLYAFPHAGAGPGALAGLAPHLPPSVEPWALNLPGRQARLAEPPRTDLDALVDDVAADLAASPGPYALFGYCGGALLAHLALRRVAAVGGPLPRQLVVGSFAAPDVAVVPRRLHLLPAESFWDVVLAQGGVAPQLAARTELRPVFEAGLRADFALYAGYHHRRTEPVDVPVTVLHGRDDTGVSRGGLLGWRRHTTVGVELRELPAGHWLVDEHPGVVAAALAGRVLADGGAQAEVPE